MIQFKENARTDGRTDGRTEGQTERQVEGQVERWTDYHRGSKKTATTIDHIITNFFVDTNFKTAIFKSDISDDFPICFFITNDR